jgi:hypothetical protein
VILLMVVTMIRERRARPRPETAAGHSPAAGARAAPGELR